MASIEPPRIRYCTKCVLPSASAAPLAFDENGVCTACRVAGQKDRIDWEDRAEELQELVEEYRSDGSNYDCLIPVSGGKDSHYQTYYVTQVLKLKPLLVTYHGNNYLPVGLRNLRNMRERFGVDHIFFSPSVPALKKMNRLCFRMMGDMNWHAHCGIFTYPVQIAVKHKIPLIVWGEHGFLDLAGMYSLNDRIEMTAKFRLEHAQRGYDWHDMIEETEGLTEQDLLWAKYPTDSELADVGVRGIYLGNYVNWDANNQTELMKEWGFEESPEPFERTYRRMSNLDDMHENGAHDYLKYVKFGYGRGTDHACKDIRSGKMTRDEGIEMVRKYDAVKPMKDLTRWLEYVGMSEREFDETADTFRDPRVWVRDENGEWIKDNIWDFDARREAELAGASS
jgi:N-acetyl sugar amidotransferase